jgi:hypothetical protein
LRKPGFLSTKIAIPLNLFVDRSTPVQKLDNREVVEQIMGFKQTAPVIFDTSLAFLGELNRGNVTYFAVPNRDCPKI